MTRQETHIARREPDRVMTLKRLGSLHQCRLSFMRVLTRRMANEAWTFSRNRFDIDDNGRISVTSPLDREMLETYVLTVKATTMTSPALVAYSQVTVQVMDVKG